MRAIVVGGTRGIGAGIADLLHKDGHRVCTMSRVKVLDGGNHPFSHEPLDLRWPEAQIHWATMRAIEFTNGLDWLVLSAGLGAYLAPYAMSEERVQDMFQVNVFGPIQVYRSALKNLLKVGGKVLFIGSTVARKPGASGLSVYAATKGAIDSFVISEARRLAKHEVAMNVLAPGWVETPMTADIKPDLRKAIQRAIPVKRFGTVEEVAHFAVNILDTPHFLTGEILSMAGGG